MSQYSDAWANDTSVCFECGVEVWPDVGRAYVCGPATQLCFECAARRGGVYDGDRDRWAVAPDLAGVFDERRPHP